MKIAFCFLSYGNVNQSNIWKHFFINNSEYNIYIHNKNPITDDFKKYSIPNIINTKWGDISLVKATIELLKEAYKCEDNHYFILLSDSCIPLHDFNYIYDKIINYNCSIINEFENTEEYIKNKYDQMNDKLKYKLENFKKQHQWILLKRDLVEWYINNIYFDDFKNINTPDEYYFINLFNRFNLSKKYKLKSQPLTFVNWNELSNNPKYRILPKTYDYLSEMEYNLITKNNYLFLRKISDICKFQYNYNKQIHISLFDIIYKWTTNKIYWLQLEDKKHQLISLLGTYFFLNNNKINYEVINYEDINKLEMDSNIIISGNYYNNNFNKKIIELQNKYNLLLLPHSNLNKFLIKKFNTNIITIAKDEKTYNFYKSNNIKNCYIHYDMGFYIDINKFKLEYLLDKIKGTEILYNDENILNFNEKEIYLICQNLFNSILKYDFIKTNQIDIIISCILLGIECSITDKNHSLNKSYYDYFFCNVKNIKFDKI